jgi:uncharacterized protein YcbX
MSLLSKPWIIPVIGSVMVVGTAIVAALWYYHRGRNEAPADTRKFTIPVARVQHLWVHPIKGCHRLEVNNVQCLTRGFQHDRCWVVIDKDNRVVQQSKAPKLATVIPQVINGPTNNDGMSPTLVLNAPNVETLIVPPSDLNLSTLTRVQLFNMRGEGHDIGDEAGEWISNLINMDGCRIIYMSDNNIPRKLTDHNKFSNISQPSEETSFANFAPVFITSESSLVELNSKLDDPIPMTRFRPNIVLKDCLPHLEDECNEIRIGDTCTLRKITPGPRCSVTTIDQETGEKSANDEPLKTLRSYRNYDKVYGVYDSRYTSGPLFGADYGVIQTGTIAVGDKVFIRN